MPAQFTARLIAARSVTLVLLLIAGSHSTRAASPTSGSVNQSGPIPSFDGTWIGTATGSGSSAGEASCVEGINCDTFRLTVAPGDYSGKSIAVQITWTNSANDYDIYVHKCPGAASTAAQCNAATPVAQASDSPPQTEENVAVAPNSTGAGDYTIHVVYAAVSGPPDQYHGSVKINAQDSARTANYVSGDITFSPTVTTKAPLTTQDGEPSSRSDSFGNFYVSGTRAFPAGDDLWYFDLQPGSGTYDPFLRSYVYRGQPDGFSPANTSELGSDGHGNYDFAVGLPDPTTGSIANPAAVSLSSLVGGQIKVQRSTDRGANFVKNNSAISGGAPADDRQWQEFLGTGTVYLAYRTVSPAMTQVQRSIDSGFSFDPAQTAPSIGPIGSIDVHQKTGTVYVSGSDGKVCHSTVILPSTEAASYQCTQAASDSNGVAHHFFVAKVADDGTPNGTVYGCYSNGHDIFIVHSSDRGVTWAAPAKVNNGNGAMTNVMPWIETGLIPGSIGIVWYGTSSGANDDSANWKAFFAQSFNATANKPTFRQVKASDHFVHSGSISNDGTSGTGNDNLLDYFQISFDPTGAAVIGFTDDHNDFSGHVYVTRQISGPKMTGDGKTTVPDPGPSPMPSGPLPIAAGNLPAAQVTDFGQDVAGAVGASDPLDLLSVKYSCEALPNGDTGIIATMKVSDLAVLPASSTWRASFTANAPFAGLSPTGDFSFALSDRGDQFFVQLSTDTSSAPSFTYGTATRDADGALTYSTRGAAACGLVDSVNDTITVKINLRKLNQLVSHGPPISSGSVLTGLRAAAFDAQTKSDITRGGTEYTVGNCATYSGECGSPPTISDIADQTTNEAASAGPILFSVDDADGESGSLTVTGSSSDQTLVPDSNIGFGGSGSNRSITITPAPNQVGTVTITATVGDGVFDTSDTFQLTIEAVPTPTPTSTPTATPSPGSLGNLSTRLRVETGDNVLIGGFIISGKEPKTVIVRAIGPSLTANGEPVPGRLADPTLELYRQGDPVPIHTNDNWVNAPNQQEIIDSTVAPKSDFESAILTQLAPDAYTAIVRGAGESTGVGLVEVYGLDSAVDSQLAQISTRGFVQTGDNVMIGGLYVIGSGTQKVIVRAIGPSLPVEGKLLDPMLELHDGNGDLIESNDNWRSDQEAEIIETTVPPPDDAESALVGILNPGPYTAIVRGVNNSTGVALVEVYALD